MVSLAPRLRSQLTGRRVDQALLVVACGLGTVGAVALALGGGRWRLGPLALSVQSPLRTIALGIALLLLREALRPAARASWLRGAVLVFALAAVLALDSRPRLVGDGLEYVAMARNLSRGRPPALTVEERAAVESLFAPAPGALGAPSELLTGPDGRQDFHHFWLYPLLAAPFFGAVAAAGGPPLAGFAAANLLLLALAAAAVHRRAGPGATLVLFAGPLLWWIDKPHPEVLFVSALAAALALAPQRPEWALPVAALAAAQNPVFLPVLAVGSTWAWLRHRGRPWLWTSLAASWALAAARPLYYLSHLGRTEPLRETVLPHVPGVAELWAVLGDPNLGLFAGWPATAVLAVVGVAMAVARLRRPSPATTDVLALGLALAALLVLFTQPGNINHGGTRGMSRYAVWLVPFLVPVLAALSARTSAFARAGVAGLGVLSIVSLFPEYVPARAERYLEPTPLARWLWTRHPGLDRPLPEVFAERAWGYPPLGFTPAATAGCEKALVRGDGTPVGRWPLPCAPAEKPEACRAPGALCYADGGPPGYRFSSAPSQPTFRDEGLQRWHWTGAPSAALADEMRALPWPDLSLVDPRDEGVFVAARQGAGRLQIRTAPGAYAVWLDGARRADAWLAPRALHPATAILVDPLTGEDLGRTGVDPGCVARVALPPRAPLLLVVREGR